MMRPYISTAALAAALALGTAALPVTAFCKAPAPPAGDEQVNPSLSSDPDMSAAATVRPKEGREAKVGGITAGSIVQSPAGEAIGRVRDIVPDTNTGDPAYVIISTRSGTTAVPYPVIAPMYQSGHVVLDRARLQSAPHVQDSELKDKDGSSWMKQSDQYWQSQGPTRLR